MGSIVELQTSNCKNCYRCIRECPIKAIRFNNDRALIIEDECIECGVCVEVCPQKTRCLKCDIDKVRNLLQGDKPVYVSVAPSWVSWFEGVSFSQLSAALKKLGFAGVEETAIGACESTREYASLIKNGQMKNIIVTACSSVVMLVERHYPDLIKMLAPVSSPMMAHARLMRETYGDIKVVFMGPCISKMNETASALAGGLVNHTLNFYDVQRWLVDENIEFNEEDKAAVGVKESIFRAYPKPNGVLATIPTDCKGYTRISVDGVYRCVELFDEISKKGTEGLFIEANICPGGCAGGPVFRIGGKNSVMSLAKIEDKAMPQDANPAKTTEMEFPHPRVFMNRSNQKQEPTEDEIKAILARMGKFSADQELNCGGCGYKTCRAKARAVFFGKADVNMCLPFLRERAENMSNMVLEHSPNAIFAFDEDLMLLEINPKGEKVLNTSKAEAIGLPVPMFYGDSGFEDSRRGEPVTKRIKDDRTDTYYEQTITYVAQHRSYIVHLKDISEEEKRKQILEKARDHTVEVAQRVIDKQMTVAQEIASLLGETTAETKVALTNLKKSMADIADDNH